MYIPEKFQAYQPKVIVLKFIVLSYAVGVTFFPHFNVPKFIKAPFFTDVVLCKQFTISPFVLDVSD